MFIQALEKFPLQYSIGLDWQLRGPQKIKWIKFQLQHVLIGSVPSGENKKIGLFLIKSKCPFKAPIASISSEQPGVIYVDVSGKIPSCLMN